jgi:hypothetical protein
LRKRRHLSSNLTSRTFGGYSRQCNEHETGELMRYTPRADFAAFVPFSSRMPNDPRGCTIFRMREGAGHKPPRRWIRIRADSRSGRALGFCAPRRAALPDLEPTAASCSY